MGAPDDPLRREVFAGDGYKPFGELTAADAKAQAQRLRGISGGGLDAKVGPVRQGWQELAEVLAARGEGATVADLGPEEAAAFAERLWVTPPGGTLLP